MIWGFTTANELTDTFSAPASKTRDISSTVDIPPPTAAGQDQVPLLGFGCYFLLQEVGKAAKGSQVFGQFIEACNSGGVPGRAPGDAPGPYIIQLYKDPDSPDA